MLRNVSYKQLLLLLLIFFLLFGDFFRVKKRLSEFLKYLQKLAFDKNRKKGI